jgi:hypothetical protein
MDNRIEHDPRFEVMPDHAGPHYDILRNALTQNGMTLKQAVLALNDSWTQNRDARIQAWDQQVADDVAALLAANQPPQGQQPPDDPPQQQEEDRVDGEKKLKMRDFDDDAVVGNYNTCPVCFAPH